MLFFHISAESPCFGFGNKTIYDPKRGLKVTDSADQVSYNEHHPDIDILLSYLPHPSLHDQSLEVERVDANYQNYQLRMGSFLHFNL